MYIYYNRSVDNNDTIKKCPKLVIINIWCTSAVIIILSVSFSLFSMTDFEIKLTECSAYQLVKKNEEAVADIMYESVM